jgi:predicted negative regulator of RcsB-dependent stress response
MKSLIKKLENIYSAAAYAEAGEFDTAKQIMNEVRTEKRVRKISKLERVMMAITFAEANEHDTAIEIMRGEKRPQKRDRITPRHRNQLRAK